MRGSRKILQGVGVGVGPTLTTFFSHQLSLQRGEESNGFSMGILTVLIPATIQCWAIIVKQPNHHLNVVSLVGK